MILINQYPIPFWFGVFFISWDLLKILVFLTWSSVNLVKIKAGNYDTGGGSNLQDIEEKHGIVSDISIGYKNKYVLQ